MAGSRDLTELYSAMNKSERRYCRLMLASGAGRRAESCLRLFDAMSRLSRPDEQTLRAAVANEPFAKHLSATSNNLYEHLLRSLAMFDAANRERSRVRSMIATAEVLWERGLYRQAHQRVAEAQEIARQFGFLSEQIALVRLEWLVDASEGYSAVEYEDLIARRDRVDNILKDASNYWDYLTMFSVASRELLRRGPGGAGSRERLERIVRAPLERLEPPRTLPAQRLRMETLRTYHLLRANYHDAFEHSLQYLAFVESQPMSARLLQFNYPTVLHNHVQVAVRIGRIDNARRAFATLNSLEVTERAMSRRIRQLLFCCRLELLMVDFDDLAIEAMADELDEVCSALENGFARQLRIGYAVELASAQFVNGRLRDAARTLHPIINDLRPGFRDDALCIARLLRLMIHFDLGDTELLPYLIRSAYRFIARSRGISDVDRAVLRFMRRLTNLASREELAAEFVRVRLELDAIAQDPAECDASALRCILPWLDARITGRTYGEVARETRAREARAGEARAGEARTAPARQEMKECAVP